MINSAPKLITAQSVTAVSVTELKAQLPVRISGTGDDVLLEQLIATAQEEIELYTAMKLSGGTYDLYLTAFPSREIILPYNPIQSVTSVTYYDASNALQTWAATNYYSSVHEKPFRIRYTSSASIPSTYEDRFDAVIVRFVCGYTSPATVPAALKQAILLLATDLYINRDDKVRTMFTMWQRLAAPYRVFHELGENQS